MQPILSQATRSLYGNYLKPYFFRRDPEEVHNFMTDMGKRIGAIPPLRWATRWLWAYNTPSLQKHVDCIVFPNPIGLSAGFDYNGELVNILPAVGFGFHTIGTVTLEAYRGNPTPRLGRFPLSKALLVNKGLKNIGAKKIIKKLKHYHFKIPVGISIASTNKFYGSDLEQMKDITECFRLFEHSTLKHAYYELNISCPNTFGGEPFTSPQRLERLLKHMDALKLTRPLYVKMPIDQSPAETLNLLKVLDVHQVQGVVFGNLTKDKKNPAVHPTEQKSWQLRKGNVSGKPTWERSNTLIALTRKHYPTRFTIIGTGGVFSGEDAAEKIRLGADLVQLITGMIYQGPQLIGEINRYLDHQN